MIQANDLLSIDGITKEECETLLAHAAEYESHGYPHDRLAHRIIGTLFFEQSTRTRLSFESAARRLGSSTIGFSGTDGLSMKKGESFEDTVRVISGYVDCIVLRHPDSGSAVTAAQIAEVPVVNAGDGTNEHPTQTLIDLYAMYKTQHRLDDLNVALVGDLKYGRTMHSLAKGLSFFSNTSQYWVAPDALRMPDDVKTTVTKHCVHIEEIDNLAAVIADMDIVVMTRVQEERFDDHAQYEQLKDVLVLSEKLLTHAKPTMRILHPLPRRYEIPQIIDASPHAYYFQQAWGGVPVRAALLAMILGR